MKFALILFTVLLTSSLFGQVNGTINVKKTHPQYLAACYNEINWFQSDSLSTFIGTVKDTSGYPISCANVILFRNLGKVRGSLEISVHTDSSGIFKINGIIPGTYRLTIGCRTHITGYFYSVVIRPNEVINSTFNLYEFKINTPREIRRSRRGR